ncbi:polyphenol oxidase family protein [Rubritalea tangerina]|uniref:Polyphenol oxidase family protein n=1 Tax=Rubritalea tangerina TaxID=430798 RepID=A0ABW4ZCV4_9BACT
MNDKHFLAPLKRDGIAADFIGRIAGVPVDTDREATVARLEPMHREVVESLGFAWESVARAEQVHGGEVAVVEESGVGVISGVDGLVTNVPGVMLGIYVADCGAVYLFDRKQQAIGLVHSGKKGTEAEIVRVALEKMGECYGTQASDVVAVLAPCIRPPAYEVDFAKQIMETLASVGVKESYDCGICTSSDLDAYYSYRLEKGATGRMIALLGIQEGEK